MNQEIRNITLRYAKRLSLRNLNAPNTGQPTSVVMSRANATSY